MVWMVVPLRLTFTRWRFLLLAAFVLLAAAMGGGDAMARAGLVPALSACPDDRGCEQRLTAPAQPALIQATLRIDGKALTGASHGGPALPVASAFFHQRVPAEATPAEPEAIHARRLAAGPGQPRGPPARP